MVGEHVTLMGSSWSIVKLALTLAMAAKSNRNLEGCVTLIMPSSGPLAALVPR